MGSKLVAVTLAALCTTSGCMGLMLHQEIKRPTRDGTLPAILFLGLIGDALVATGASVLHGAISDDPDVSWKGVFPYYGGVLLGIDAVIFAIEYDRYKNR